MKFSCKVLFNMQASWSNCLKISKLSCFNTNFKGFCSYGKAVLAPSQSHYLNTDLIQLRERKSSH